MPYTVTEPHPSVDSARPSHYILAGIGGAGNYHRYATSNLTSGPSATGPASRANLPQPPTSARMMTGRGGAGNVRSNKPAKPTAAATVTALRTSSDSTGSTPDLPLSPSQRAMFSFDEELERDQRMRDNAARVYHTGRGGAGNAFSSIAPGIDKRHSSSSSSHSGSSHGSSDSKRRAIQGMMDKISRTISRS